MSFVLDDATVLPDGWREAVCSTHSRPFYVNSVSGHAQWERPLYPASERPTEAPPEKSEVPVGTPVTASSVAAVTEPPDVTDADEHRSALATHIRPSHERKAGNLCVGFAPPDVPAPAVKATAMGTRWCIIEDGQLFVLPKSDSPASELLLKLGLVGVRGVTCPTELQAGCAHALLLELSPEPRSREGWQGMGMCTQLVLVASSAEEQQEWHMTLARVATAYRNYRRLSEAPGAVLGGAAAVSRSVMGLALHAAGSGLGWQVGRDAGASVSRAVGLRR